MPYYFSMSSCLASVSDESECKITAFSGYMQIKMLFGVFMFHFIAYIEGLEMVDMEANMAGLLFVELVAEFCVLAL